LLQIAEIKLQSITKEESSVEDQFFVGWGTLTLINAGLAQGKNRSGLHWFFISFFLGPIATLALVILEKLPEEDENNNAEYKNEDFCNTKGRTNRITVHPSESVQFC